MEGFVVPFPDLVQPELGAYRSGVETPADFTSFWDDTIAKARAAGGQAAVVPVKTNLRAVEAFDVTFPGFGGHPVKGWLVLPAQRAGRVPLVVQYIGYGGGRGLPHEHLHWAAAGYAHFRMDTRGQGTSISSVGDTADPVGSGPAIFGMMTRGILSLEDYYFRRLFTDGVRAIDALAGLGVIDPERMAVTGRSQGGGIALAVAGLDKRIRAAMPNVPFLSDFPRAVRKAQRDPYLEIVRYLAQHRDRASTVFETLRYFDGVCFARQAKVEALFSVGLMDDVCPPSTIYGAYNAYAGPKQMVEYEFNNHEGGGAHHDICQLEWLGSRFRP
jgi:cephalosporin-C deacetylase